MSYSIYVVSENRSGGVGPERTMFVDAAPFEDLWRRSFEGSFSHLRLIDPYGLTFFSREQMKAVVPELERMRSFAKTESETQVLEEILVNARHVRDDAVHHFLLFAGD